MELKEQLDALKAELKGYFEKAADQQKAQGTVTEELKTKIDALQKQADALDVKLAERHAAGQPEQTLIETLQKTDGLEKFMKSRTGSFSFELDAKQTRRIFERKTAIDSAAVGVSTSGVLQIERTPGIVHEARQMLTIRNVLTSRPTLNQLVDYVKVNSPLTTASPQIEQHTKKENAVTFTTVSERVRTLATWIPASRQILDDFTELEGFLRASLPYYVDLAEEQQMLTGSGSGEDLHGLITQATAFSTSLLSAPKGWTKVDIIGRVVQQITVAKELAPSFVVLHPNDYWDIALTKDSQGRYLFGDPLGPVGEKRFFGLIPVITTSISSGTFLVGSGAPVATEIRDRMGMTVEIATQHGTYFTENMIAIRAEKRLALVVYRPASFITGTFTTSP